MAIVRLVGYLTVKIVSHTALGKYLWLTCQLIS